MVAPMARVAASRPLLISVSETYRPRPAGPGLRVLSIALLACSLIVAVGDVSPGAPARLERSYWLHASLGPVVQRGYWGPAFPRTEPPDRNQVDRAAQLLAGHYAANRLYLIYHREVPWAQAERVFQWWCDAAPPAVELVPALVLKMYDRPATPVFTQPEVHRLAEFFARKLHCRRVAVYDVAKGRDQGPELGELARWFPGRLIRLGLQPGEGLPVPLVAGVEDTWSAFCHGTRNVEDWSTPGFGAQTLRDWVQARNAGTHPITWNLISVAWDYRVTARGAYPGYDDAARNQPLPAGRNRLGVQLIRKTARSDVLAGVSSDLFILHENSRSPAHDGPAGAFYTTLKAGRPYQGYYSSALDEIAAIYRQLRDGQWPDP